jgi:hypothetical protein
MDFGDKVLILDRGYASCWLLYLLMEKNVKFVMRVKQSESRAVKQFMQSPHQDVTTQWYIGHRSGKRLAKMNRVISRTAGLSVRMVKVMLTRGNRNAGHHQPV